MNQIETMIVECLGCGEQIHPKRLEILPNTKHCVQCSDTGRKRGVTVYGKFQSDEDFSDFDSLPWIELTQVTPVGVYSDPKNLNDFREFEFKIPEIYKNSEGYFAYTAAAPATGDFVRFKKYSIKIVLTAIEGQEYNPPRITDLRVIALQK